MTRKFKILHRLFYPTPPTASTATTAATTPRKVMIDKIREDLRRMSMTDELNRFLRLPGCKERLYFPMNKTLAEGIKRGYVTGYGRLIPAFPRIDIATVNKLVARETRGFPIDIPIDWICGPRNAGGNAESSWGKKKDWNSGDAGKESGKGAGSTEENKDSVWGKMGNCNTGSSGSGGSQWGSKGDWNSGSNDGNANRNSGWGNKSNWNSQQENANQDSLGVGHGNRGGWRGGSGGRGGADRGGFRGRGDRGGFGGRGGFRGRGRSDRGGFGGRGGFRGRGRSDRGGFGGRGRGRRDFNSGSDNPAGGWNRGHGSSGQGGGWSSQASGWNKGGGSGDADATGNQAKGWNQSGAAGGGPSGSGWGNSKEGGEGTDAGGGSSGNWGKPSSSAWGNNDCGGMMEEWHQKLHNNTSPDDVVICQGWHHALNLFRSNNDEWAIYAKSVLDRTRLALAGKAEWYQQILQPSAEYLGSLLAVDEWAVNMFTEEIIRGGSAAALSSLINRLDPVLRKTAHLGSWQVISPVEAVGYVVVVDELLTVQNKSYDRPTILVAKRVKGEEEIPDGAVAVLTPDMPDVLSHVSVRARNGKICFATCFDPNILNDLQSSEGKLMSLKPTSVDVVYSELNEHEFADSRSANVEVGPHPLKLVRKQFSGRYAISSEEFTNEMVGAKSRNIGYLKGKVPSWIGIPTSVALPFGVFEKLLSDDSNTSIDALADALDEFTGGVVLVSHGSRLMSRAQEE